MLSETTMGIRTLVMNFDVDVIVVNTIVDFHDATFFEDMFPINSRYLRVLLIMIILAQQVRHSLSCEKDDKYGSGS